MVGDGALLECRLPVRSPPSSASRPTWSLPAPSSTWCRGCSRMDVFVLSSLREGISNTVLEAMAAGRPVVASAVGGNVELVESGGPPACWSRRAMCSALEQAMAPFSRGAGHWRCARGARHGERARSHVTRWTSMVEAYSTPVSRPRYDRARRAQGRSGR